MSRDWLQRVTLHVGQLQLQFLVGNGSRFLHIFTCCALLLQCQWLGEKNEKNNIYVTDKKDKNKIF